MYGKYKIQSMNAKYDIRNLYSENQAKTGGRIASSNFQSSTREGCKDTTSESDFFHYLEYKGSSVPWTI